MTAGVGPWIGADPGGVGRFGLAILDSSGAARTWVVDCADEAVRLLREELSEMPGGLGVDAPLWWSSGRSSDRSADQWLRERYGLSGGQVQGANSLRGAALVQGAMLVHLMRQSYPKIRVTEAHPKALLTALNLEWADFVRRFDMRALPTTLNEHERDAVIAAVAAREGCERRWTRDLGTNRLPTEQDPSRYWLAPVHYYWPEA